MKDIICVMIVEKINEITKGCGIVAEANLHPIQVNTCIHTIEIELCYDNFYRVERFNNTMYITEEDVVYIAKGLVKKLMCDYFDVKFYNGEV